MTYPTEPPELTYAYAVSIDGLKPWEFDACPADSYYLISVVRSAFEQERKAARRQIGGEE